MEPIEAKEFADHAREAGEAGLTRVSIVISLLAALLALVTVMGHREHTEEGVMTSEKDNQWMDFQAHQIRIVQESIAIDVLTLQPAQEEATYAVQQRLQYYKADIEKLKKSKDKESEQANEYKHEVDVAGGRASRYDLGEALLQIAIVLASITLLTKHQRYVYLGSSVGLAGVVAAASALLVK